MIDQPNSAPNPMLLALEDPSWISGSGLFDLALMRSNGDDKPMHGARA